MAQLRHNSFHFNSGFGADMKALEDKPSGHRPGRPCRDRRAVDGGQHGPHRAAATRHARQPLRFFFDQGQNRALFAKLSDHAPSVIPLPRFNRLLQRADNAWSKGKDNLDFPAPANRTCGSQDDDV